MFKSPVNGRLRQTPRYDKKTLPLHVGRGNLSLSMRLAVRPHLPCSSGSPDPDLFGLARARTGESWCSRPIERGLLNILQILQIVKILLLSCEFCSGCPAWRGPVPRPTLKGAALFTVARGPIPAMPCLGSPAVPLTLATRLSSSPSPIDRLLTPPPLRAVRLCHR